MTWSSLGRQRCVQMMEILEMDPRVKGRHSVQPGVRKPSSDEHGGCRVEVGERHCCADGVNNTHTAQDMAEDDSGHE